ncbi:hypothetical protein LCGC14_2945340 [marine sediment metagenome]|uniref:Uncharacterized protein n=1 Tax=marine sediment metagenome TaxID=412755 RepID=A0A0F9A7Z6_9ZZZZ
MYLKTRVTEFKRKRALRKIGTEIKYHPENFMEITSLIDIYKARYGIDFTIGRMNMEYQEQMRRKR